MMNDVALMILIHLHARRGLCAQPEMEATLRGIGSWLHAGFHDALADGGVVGKPRHVPDVVMHGSGWQRRFDRVRQIALVKRRVNLVAVALDPTEVGVRIV